jgi:hypothetical protein
MTPVIIGTILAIANSMPKKNHTGSVALLYPRSIVSTYYIAKAMPSTRRRIQVLSTALLSIV